jgi:tripartite-type tricarboxylate transporter receptor subunit TctC
MNMMKRASLAVVLIAFLAGLLAGIFPALAETYPSRPITLIVGFPPGGPTDALARILAEGLRTALGQTVVVETVSGASGTIAAGRVVHADPDGYTIGIGNWTSHVGSPAIYRLDYDVHKDLQPISLLATSPLWILGKTALPPQNVGELISWVKKSAQPATFGTVGTGSAAQLCGIYFQQKTAAHLQFVPYRGAGPAIQDIIAGHIDLSCLEASSTLPTIQAGKARAYALLSETRWPKAPDTPTMIESGFPGLSISFWHGLWTTKGTPQPVVDRLVAAVQTALADPAVKGRLEALGQVVYPRDQQTPAALAAFHKAETEKWWPVIKAAGITTE